MRSARFLIVATAAAILIALPASASADVLFASPTGSASATSCPTDNRCSIEHAVEDLAGTDDIVEAGPGNYSVGTLTVQDKITLRGEPGAAQPRIVGTSQPLAVAFAGDGATIQDVTIDLVGNGTAVVLGGSATIVRSLILARGPGNAPADADALFSASGGTLRDTTIRVKRSPAAMSHATVLSSAGVLTLRNVSVTRQDSGEESAVGLGGSGSPAIDADGLVIEARRCLTLGGPGHSIVHNLTATQPAAGGGITTPVVAAGTAQIDGAAITSTAGNAGVPAALITGSATLSNATIDAPASEGVRVDTNGRLDRVRIKGMVGIDMFGAATVTNTLALVSGDFAGRYGGPGPTAQVRNSTLVGGAASTGFRKDAGGTVELLNTIVSAGTDIKVNAGAVAARNSRFATVGAGAVTDQGGNIAAGPQFLDPTVGDYRLQPDSPMVDAGATHDLLGPVDLGGLPRVSGPLPDIGAYEFQHPAPPAPPAPTPEQPAQPSEPEPTGPSGPVASGGGQPSATAPVDALAPVLRGTSLTPRRFAVGARNVRLRFTLSEPATVAVHIASELPGRSSGGRCRAPSRRLAKRPRCTRLAQRGSRKVDGAAGPNSVPFDARGLKPGPHRVTLVPSDAARNGGGAATARFTVVKARKR
jgi:hypothetical protein